MKPSKRCHCCNKPIWDSGFLSIRDSYMDCDMHIHSQCYEDERATTVNDETRAAMKASMLILDRWVMEDDAEYMNAVFDRKLREIEMAYEDRSYNDWILSLGEDG